MRSNSEQIDAVENDPARELMLLSEVQDSPETSQRHLAQQLGVSLGLTNLLLRNLSRKGYVRITQAGWRRWLYALTPAGFSRKVQLVVAYIGRFMDQYRMIRRSLREELDTLSLHAESRVAIYGTGEFAELVYLGLREFSIEEVMIFDTGVQNGRRFLGMPVQDVATLRPDQYDRVMVAILEDVQTRSLELRDLGVTPNQLVTLFANDSQEGAEESEGS